MTFQIYKITNNKNGKSYVGFTSQTLYKRFQQHCRSKSDTLLHRAIKKYGKESFSIESLFQSDNKETTLSLMEEKFIREYHTHLSENGYNMN